MTLLPLAAASLLGAARAGVVQGSQADLDAVYAPRRVAVLVGIDEYSDPKLQGLRFAAKDARDLGQVLAQPDHGGFDRVLVVEGAAATTAAELARAIRVATADLQRDDTFLLYMSGHGTLTLDAAAGSRLWFLPSDGRLDEPTTTGIAVADVEALVNALPARRRVLVLDTCHNGRSDSKSAVNAATAQLLDGMRGEPPAPRDLREVSESEARLFAAQYYQPAMEDPDLENGVYTHYLIEALTSGLAQADLDGDGLVDVAEAHDYARDRTIKRTGGLQVPRAEYRIVGREEIYLAGDTSMRARAERALISATDELLARARILVDGVPRGELPGLLAVDPGRREVEVQAEDGRTLARRTLRLDAGQTLAVESLFAQREPRLYVLGGGAVHHGPGHATWLPWAGEVEAAWVDPFLLVDHSRTDLHLRASLAWGTIPEQDDFSVLDGEIAGGGALGWGGRHLTVGPLAEFVVPWRSFDNETGPHRQVTVTGAAGARALATFELGTASLALRYDARFVPYQHDGVWTSLWHHGLALGLSR